MPEVKRSKQMCGYVSFKLLMSALHSERLQDRFRDDLLSVLGGLTSNILSSVVALP